MKALTSKEKSNQQNIGTKSGAVNSKSSTSSKSSNSKTAELSSAGNKKAAKDLNGGTKKRKKQRKHSSSDTSRSQPLMAGIDKSVASSVASSVRTPETMAKILLILYTHAIGAEFHTYNLGIGAFKQLSGMPIITDEYVSTIDKYLRPNHFCLIRIKDNFSVTTLAELLTMQVMDPNVVCRYLPRNIKDTVLESEYAKLNKSWRWSLKLQ